MASPSSATLTRTPARSPARWNPRARLRQWWHNRLPLTDALTLTQRNVYILPTRAGLMLAITLLVLLLGSVNYQLNLGYLLTFWLAGSAVVGMHVCHGNLRGLNLSLSPPEPVFAGQSARVTVRLSQSGRRWRRGIALKALQDGPRAARPDGVRDAGDWVWTDVPPQGEASVELACPMHQRGRQPLPTLSALTRYPLGTFRVWCLWRPAASVTVFPAPEQPPPPLPPGEPRGAATLATTGARQAGEFDGVRAYRRGDPLKLVVWKKAAQSWSAQRHDLVSRDTASPQRMELWLDAARCGLSEPEGRLSRLSAWVLAAEKAGLDYGLRLAGQEIAPDQGPAHQRRCLEALALC